MKPTFATKVTDSVCKWASGSIVLVTSALRKHAGYSEIRSRSNVWKEQRHTEGHIYDYTHFLLQILGLFLSYIYKTNGCKKKTKPRLLCTLFWNGGLKSIQLATIPGCWKQRIWGTSLPHICPWNGACKGDARSPWKKRTLKFSLWSIKKVWHHVEFLTMVILVQNVRW